VLEVLTRTNHGEAVKMAQLGAYEAGAPLLHQINEAKAYTVEEAPASPGALIITSFFAAAFFIVRPARPPGGAVFPYGLATTQQPTVLAPSSISFS
jgi:hypothetical protein